MSLIIAFILLIIICVSLFPLFTIAGQPGWAAFVPFYNFYIWLKLTGKPWWWIIILLFPGPNIILLCTMSANLGSAFGRRSGKDLALFFFLPFVMLPLLATKKPTYLGPIDRVKIKKTSTEEWRDAILFAWIAAGIIRIYVFELFTIPTSSMEKSLLIGDYLVVNKVAYGPKVPETPLSVPFFHHSVMGTQNVPAYLDWLHIPYTRLPGYSSPKNNDVMVFTYPAGDTVDIEMQSNANWNQIRNQIAFSYEFQDLMAGGKMQKRSSYLKRANMYMLNSRPYTTRPVDKRENFIKRCVGIAGDDIEIKDGILFVNGEQAHMPEDMQYNYLIKTTPTFNLSRALRKKMKEEMGIHFQDTEGAQFYENEYILPLTAANVDKMKAINGVISVERIIAKKDTFSIYNQQKMNEVLAGTDSTFKANFMSYIKANNAWDLQLDIFPNNRKFNWTVDNFGPLHIPAKGETVELTLDNLPLYSRIITVYERHTLAVKAGKIYIDDKEADTYTFDMDYFWLMGDNRHNSADSRFWGFVPEDHVVGKASLVWMSMDHEGEGIRTDRLFKVIE